jgi:hypothetical protein
VTLCEPIIEIAGINGIHCNGYWSNFWFSIIPLLVLSHVVINMYVGYILVYIVHYGGCETCHMAPKKFVPTSTVPVLLISCTVPVAWGDI